MRKWSQTFCLNLMISRLSNQLSITLFLSAFSATFLGTRVEWHSLSTQVCLPAIKTRQLALIFYTTWNSQKAITHKFLIMLCLLASITTRSFDRRIFTLQNVLQGPFFTRRDFVEGEAICFSLGNLFNVFKWHMEDKKMTNLISDNWF